MSFFVCLLSIDRKKRETHLQPCFSSPEPPLPALRKWGPGLEVWPCELWLVQAGAPCLVPTHQFCAAFLVELTLRGD